MRQAGIIAAAAMVGAGVTPWEHIGAAVFVLSVLLDRAARRRLIVGEGGIFDAETRGAVVGFVLASAAVAAASWGVLAAWDRPEGWASGAARTGAAVIAGMVVYGAWAAGSRRPELRWLLGRSVGRTMPPSPPTQGPTHER